MSSNKHEGRTYVVTGAASGIGAATAAYLRAAGGHVITSDLHDADVLADLATPDGRAALTAAAETLTGGRLDGIIANAGGGPVRTMLSLNFFGAVATLENLRPLLAASAAPRAVLVSSVSSVGAAEPALVEVCLSLDERAAEAAQAAALGADGASLPLYGSAKRALNRWCRRVAITPEWAGAGIPLNVIAPGVVDTPAAAWILSSVEGRAEMDRRTPMASARPAKPDDVAAMVGWSVSPEMSLMTGQVLFADGGLECRMRGDEAW